MRSTVFDTEFGPTHLIQFGLNELVTESTRELEQVGKVIFMIPGELEALMIDFCVYAVVTRSSFAGNPGNVTWYIDFLQSISTRTNIPVVAVSYYGQIAERVRETEANTLQRQIEHKLAVLKLLIPDSVKLYLMGHSIGGYVAMELLHTMNLRQRPVEHTFFLMPALERLGQTKNARIFTVLFKFRWLAFLSLMLFSVCGQRFIKSVIRLFLQCTTRTKSVPNCVVDGVYELHNWRIARNCVALGEDEFIHVTQRNDATIRANLDRATFLYAKDDGWAPVDQYEDLKKTYPTADVRFLDEARHSFNVVSRMSELVADVVVDKLLPKADVNLNVAAD